MMTARIRKEYVAATAAAFALCLIGAVPASSKTEIVLYSFCQTSGCPDGQDPYSPLVQDAAGNLFGTTLSGGNANNAGTIYELQKVRKGWAFRSLYSFCSQANCADGSTPYGGLIVDTSGNLYGTALTGGNANQGVVYELQTGGALKMLYSFCAQARCADGAQPYAGLTYSGQQSGQSYNGTSALYGTASSGGASNNGVAFGIAPGGAESLLHSFGGIQHQDDGVTPLAPLIMDGEDNLYGTTELGGSSTGGTIFEIDGSGNETVLLAFGSQGASGGDFPGTGALLMNSNGTLFGTTPKGGYYNGGVVYSFGAGMYSTLAIFCNNRESRACRTGGVSQSALIEDASGNLYGVAPLGGKNIADKGTVFEFTGSKLKVLYIFCEQAACADGAEPYSKMLMNSHGWLFGTTTQGGAFNGGTIFELR